jgi:hypothetical protein
MPRLLDTGRFGGCRDRDQARLSKICWDRDLFESLALIPVSTQGSSLPGRRLWTLYIMSENRNTLCLNHISKETNKKWILQRVGDSGWMCNVEFAMIFYSNFVLSSEQWKFMFSPNTRIDLFMDSAQHWKVSMADSAKLRLKLDKVVADFENIKRGFPWYIYDVIVVGTNLVWRSRAFQSICS